MPAHKPPTQPKGTNPAPSLPDCPSTSPAKPVSRTRRRNGLHTLLKIEDHAGRKLSNGLLEARKGRRPTMYRKSRASKIQALRPPSLMRIRAVKLARCLL